MRTCMTALTRPMPRRVSRRCPAQDKVLNGRLQPTDCERPTANDRLRGRNARPRVEAPAGAIRLPQPARKHRPPATSPSRLHRRGCARTSHACRKTGPSWCPPAPARRDRSLRRAAKRRRRTRMMHVRAPIRPHSGAQATAAHPPTHGTLDRLAKSGDLAVKWQATWRMSGKLWKYRDL